jgi:hypothetical protein
MFEFRDPKSLQTLDEAREYAAAANRALLPMRKTTPPLCFMWLLAGLSYISFIGASGMLGTPPLQANLLWFLHVSYLGAACACAIVAALVRDK